MAERKGSVSRRTKLEMYSKATSSRVCWTRWRATCPPYPATLATASDATHQSGEKRGERTTQRAQAVSRQTPA